MKSMLAIAVVLALLAVVAGVLTSKKGRGARKGTFTRRAVLTKNEQGMFWRLVSAFPAPDFVVLSQVSFGALLIAKEGASRYSFSQKRADFVLLDKSFKVLAMIELDDSSHKGQEAKDRARDGMLQAAGYQVLRYAAIPDASRLKADLAPILRPDPTPILRPDPAPMLKPDLPPMLMR